MALAHDHIDNPRGRRAIIISGIFTGIAVVIVVLRLYTRFFLVRYPGVEDYMVLLAMVFSMGLTVSIGFQAEWGMGQHIADLSLNEMTLSLKAFWCSLIVYYLALGLTKASILIQYQRLFPTPKFKIASRCIMAAVICYTFWTVFGSIFACVPVHAFWTKEPSRCINQFAMWFSNAAFNILLDVAIIILPIPVIKDLNLARRQKQALVGVFAVGAFVCVVSILRLHSLVAISNSKDQTYDNPPAATWSSVETNVGIVCSCLPLLRPLLTRCLPGILSSKKRSTNGLSLPHLFQSKQNQKSWQLHDNSNTETKKSRSSIYGAGKDIQVITDIEVKVERGEGRLSGLGTPVLAVSDKKLSFKTDPESSTETLVRVDR